MIQRGVGGGYLVGLIHSHLPRPKLLCSTVLYRSVQQVANVVDSDSLVEL